MSNTLDKLKSLFMRKPLQMTGYVYEQSRHTGWGNSINWSNYDERRLSGHLQRIPEIGDEIRWEMASGKTARYAILKVKRVGDPRDMWFADAIDLGYVGEKPINRVKEAENPQIEPQEKGVRFLL